MSNTDFREHRLLVRELIEKECGGQPIGSVGDSSSTSCYIGIHEDERDGLFKRWFTAASRPLMFTQQNGFSHESSMLLNFDGASNLLDYMNKVTSNHPPLELPSSEQLMFVRERLPSILTLHYTACARPDDCCSTTNTASTRAPKIEVTLIDTDDVNFITRDDPYSDDIGFILPVYSQPVPQLGLGRPH